MYYQQLVLPDGRKLGFSQRGLLGGKPVFYFHGSPSSRLESDLFISNELLNDYQIWLISIDRPGIGLSDYQIGRVVLDWPKDVLTIADSLEIDRFAVLANSLGGPYGLACGYSIPKRLTHVGIVSGAAVYANPNLMVNINKGTRNYLELPREKPWMAKFFLIFMRLIAKIAPTIMVKNAYSLLPPPDKHAFSEYQLEQPFTLMVNEAFRQGIRGPYQESLLMVQDWGFKLQDVGVPINLWNGTEDQNVPIEMAKYVSESLPDGELNIIDGEGHLSLFAKNVEKILRNLLE